MRHDIPSGAAGIFCSLMTSRVVGAGGQGGATRNLAGIEANNSPPKGLWLLLPPDLQTFLRPCQIFFLSNTKWGRRNKGEGQRGNLPPSPDFCRSRCKTIYFKRPWITTWPPVSPLSRFSDLPTALPRYRKPKLPFLLHETVSFSIKVAIITLVTYVLHLSYTNWWAFFHNLILTYYG